MPGKMNPPQERGQNDGRYSVSGDLDHQTAADNKYLVEMFRDLLTMEEMRQLPIAPPGTHLKQGAVYLDLAARESGPRIAIGGVVPNDEQFFVPKSEVPYELWNKLTKVNS